MSGLTEEFESLTATCWLGVTYKNLRTTDYSATLSALHSFSFCERVLHL